MTDSKLLLKRSTLSAVQEFRLQSYYGVKPWKQASNHVLAVECLGLELTGEASNIKVQNLLHYIISCKNYDTR